MALLATGATDRAIARELGVSTRTVHRKIARLQSLLGVRSRFQLGVCAAGHRWL
ncbi:MAG: HTH domain-containing protein [Saccharothrix sp.]|nr:HTH domain-containing protein [Saccharothrix sp.]NUT94953.1 HTH domain-containing protein [Saccharothrix sp.]